MTNKDLRLPGHCISSLTSTAFYLDPQHQNKQKCPLASQGGHSMLSTFDSAGILHTGFLVPAVQQLVLPGDEQKQG